MRRAAITPGSILRIGWRTGSPNEISPPRRPWALLGYPGWVDEPERLSPDAAAAAPVKAPERAPGRRELKPPEWFEERLAAWGRRMGLGAWTIRATYKPKLRGAEGYAEISPSFLEAELPSQQEESVVEAIAHALVRTAEQQDSTPANKGQRTVGV